MLGVPLGSVAFVSSFISSRLFSKVQEVTEKLIDFEDAQAALYLLRSSFGAVRAVHYMRTVPIQQWKPEADDFDRLIKECMEGILGTPLPPAAYDQACLSPRLGGLGFKRVVSHAAGTKVWQQLKRIGQDLGLVILFICPKLARQMCQIKPLWPLSLPLRPGNPATEESR